MALIICGECGRQVSDKASSCPNCGAPVATMTAKTQVAPPTQKSSGCAIAALILLGLFAFSVMIGQCSRDVESPNSPAAQSPLVPASSQPQMTAVEALAAAKSRWSPDAAPAAEHGALAAEFGRIARTYPGTPEAAEASVLLPLANAKAEQFKAQETLLAAEGKWSYRQEQDPMTSKTKFFASVQSEAPFELEFPYQGLQHARLVLRKDPRSGLNIMLIIEKGQFICRSYDGCEVSVRFDEATAKNWSVSEPADYSSETLFFNREESFLAQLQKAKVVRVQATIHDAGDRTFEFDVSGFKPEAFQAK